MFSLAVMPNGSTDKTFAAIKSHLLETPNAHDLTQDINKLLQGSVAATFGYHEWLTEDYSNQWNNYFRQALGIEPGEKKIDISKINAEQLAICAHAITQGKFTYRIQLKTNKTNTQPKIETHEEPVHINGKDNVAAALYYLVYLKAKTNSLDTKLEVPTITFDKHLAVEALLNLAHLYEAHYVNDAAKKSASEALKEAAKLVSENSTAKKSAQETKLEKSLSHKVRRQCKALTESYTTQAYALLNKHEKNNKFAVKLDRNLRNFSNAVVGKASFGLLKMETDTAREKAFHHLLNALELATDETTKNNITQQIIVLAYYIAKENKTYTESLLLALRKSSSDRKDELLTHSYNELITLHLKKFPNNQTKLLHLDLVVEHHNDRKKAVTENSIATTKPEILKQFAEALASQDEHDDKLCLKVTSQADYLKETTEYLIDAINALYETEKDKTPNQLTSLYNHLAYIVFSAHQKQDKYLEEILSNVATLVNIKPLANTDLDATLTAAKAALSKKYSEEANSKFAAHDKHSKAQVGTTNPRVLAFQALCKAYSFAQGDELKNIREQIIFFVYHTVQSKKQYKDTLLKTLALLVKNHPNDQLLVHANAQLNSSNQQDQKNISSKQEGIVSPAPTIEDKSDIDIQLQFIEILSKNDIFKKQLHIDKTFKSYYSDLASRLNSLLKKLHENITNNAVLIERASKLLVKMAILAKHNGDTQLSDTKNSLSELRYIDLCELASIQLFNTPYTTNPSGQKEKQDLFDAHLNNLATATKLTSLLLEEPVQAETAINTVTYALNQFPKEFLHNNATFLGTVKEGSTNNKTNQQNYDELYDLLTQQLATAVEKLDKKNSYSCLEKLLNTFGDFSVYKPTEHVVKAFSVIIGPHTDVRNPLVLLLAASPTTAPELAEFLKELRIAIAKTYIDENSTETAILWTNLVTDPANPAHYLSLAENYFSHPKLAQNNYDIAYRLVKNQLTTEIKEGDSQKRAEAALEQLTQKKGNSNHIILPNTLTDAYNILHKPDMVSQLDSFYEKTLTSPPNYEQAFDLLLQTYQTLLDNSNPALLTTVREQIVLIAYYVIANNEKSAVNIANTLKPFLIGADDLLKHSAENLILLFNDSSENKQERITLQNKLPENYTYNKKFAEILLQQQKHALQLNINFFAIEGYFTHTTSYLITAFSQTQNAKPTGTLTEEWQNAVRELLVAFKQIERLALQHPSTQQNAFLLAFLKDYEKVETWIYDQGLDALLPNFATVPSLLAANPSHITNNIATVSNSTSDNNSNARQSLDKAQLLFAEANKTQTLWSRLDPTKIFNTNKNEQSQRIQGLIVLLKAYNQAQDTQLLQTIREQIVLVVYHAIKTNEIDSKKMLNQLSEFLKTEKAHIKTDKFKDLYLSYEKLLGFVNSIDKTDLWTSDENFLDSDKEKVATDFSYTLFQQSQHAAVLQLGIDKIDSYLLDTAKTLIDAIRLSLTGTLNNTSLLLNNLYTVLNLAIKQNHMHLLPINEAIDQLLEKHGSETTFEEFKSKRKKSLQDLSNQYIKIAHNILAAHSTNIVDTAIGATTQFFKTTINTLTTPIVGKILDETKEREEAFHYLVSAYKHAADQDNKNAILKEITLLVYYAIETKRTYASGLVKQLGALAKENNKDELLSYTAGQLKKFAEAQGASFTQVIGIDETTNGHIIAQFATNLADVETAERTLHLGSKEKPAHPLVHIAYYFVKAINQLNEQLRNRNIELDASLPQKIEDLSNQLINICRFAIQTKHKDHLIIFNFLGELAITTEKKEDKEEVIINNRFCLLAYQALDHLVTKTEEALIATIPEVAKKSVTDFTNAKTYSESVQQQARNDFAEKISNIVKKNAQTVEKEKLTKGQDWFLDTVILKMHNAILLAENFLADNSRSLLRLTVNPIGAFNETIKALISIPAEFRRSNNSKYETTYKELTALLLRAVKLLPDNKLTEAFDSLQVVFGDFSVFPLNDDIVNAFTISYGNGTLTHSLNKILSFAVQSLPQNQTLRDLQRTIRNDLVKYYQSNRPLKARWNNLVRDPNNSTYLTLLAQYYFEHPEVAKDIAYSVVHELIKTSAADKDPSAEFLLAQLYRAHSEQNEKALYGFAPQKNSQQEASYWFALAATQTANINVAEDSCQELRDLLYVEPTKTNLYPNNEISNLWEKLADGIDDAETRLKLAKEYLAKKEYSVQQKFAIASRLLTPLISNAQEEKNIKAEAYELLAKIHFTAEPLTEDSLTTAMTYLEEAAKLLREQSKTVYIEGLRTNPVARLVNLATNYLTSVLGTLITADAHSFAHQLKLAQLAQKYLLGLYSNGAQTLQESSQDRQQLFAAIDLSDIQQVNDVNNIIQPLNNLISQCTKQGFAERVEELSQIFLNKLYSDAIVESANRNAAIAQIISFYQSLDQTKLAELWQTYQQTPNALNLLKLLQFYANDSLQIRPTVIQQQLQTHALAIRYINLYDTYGADKSETKDAIAELLANSEANATWTQPGNNEELSALVAMELAEAQIATMHKQLAEESTNFNANTLKYDKVTEIVKSTSQTLSPIAVHYCVDKFNKGELIIKTEGKTISSIKGLDKELIGIVSALKSYARVSPKAQYYLHNCALYIENNSAESGPFKTIAGMLPTPVSQTQTKQAVESVAATTDHTVKAPTNVLTQASITEILAPAATSVDKLSPGKKALIIIQNLIDKSYDSLETLENPTETLEKLCKLYIADETKAKQIAQQAHLSYISQYMLGKADTYYCDDMLIQPVVKALFDDQKQLNNQAYKILSNYLELMLNDLSQANTDYQRYRNCKGWLETLAKGHNDQELQFIKTALTPTNYVAPATKGKTEELLKHYEKLKEHLTNIIKANKEIEGFKKQTFGFMRGANTAIGVQDDKISVEKGSIIALINLIIKQNHGPNAMGLFVQGMNTAIIWAQSMEAKKQAEQMLLTFFSVYETTARQNQALRLEKVS